MIAVGIGANSRAQQQDFETALAKVGQEIGRADVVLTFDGARFAGQLSDVARQLSIAYRAVGLDDMRARNGDCVTRTGRSHNLFGVASIAEAAALAGAGPRSRLVMPRRIVGNITIAAAQSADVREHSR